MLITAANVTSRHSPLVYETILIVSAAANATNQSDRNEKSMVDRAVVFPIPPTGSVLLGGPWLLHPRRPETYLLRKMVN
jgi:hypothetical protein